MPANLTTVPTDPDTKIAAALDTLDGLPVRREVWSWDGIWGRSIIFRTSDVADLTDAELIAKVRRAVTIPTADPITLSRGDEFTFCNYGFETAADDDEDDDVFLADI